MLVDELVKFSNYYGKNSALVLAGGGNTSAKKNGFMYVKGSGTQLATITAEKFVKVKLSKIEDIFRKKYPDNDAAREAMVLEDLMDSRCPGEEHKRPSVETMLHAIFEQTFVLHLHPALVNGLTCGKGGESLAKEILGEKFIWVDACKPGYILSKICFDKMAEYRNKYSEPCDMILLQNHGIFIAADSVKALDDKLNSVMSALKSRVKVQPDFTPVAEDEAYIGELKKILQGCVCQIACRQAEIFTRDEESASVLLKPFTPDHIVYCKAYPLFIGKGDNVAGAVSEYSKKFGFNPRVIVAEGHGVFCCGADEKQSNTVKALFEDAMKTAVYTGSFGGVLHMSGELTDFIVNWEVESYRSKQN